MKVEKEARSRVKQKDHSFTNQPNNHEKKRRRPRREKQEAEDEGNVARGFNGERSEERRGGEDGMCGGGEGEGVDEENRMMIMALATTRAMVFGTRQDEGETRRTGLVPYLSPLHVLALQIFLVSPTRHCNAKTQDRLAAIRALKMTIKSRWFDESSGTPTYGGTLKRETAQDQVEVGDAKRFDGGRRSRGGRGYDETATGIVVRREDPVMMLLAYTRKVGVRERSTAKERCMQRRHEKMQRPLHMMGKISSEKKKMVALFGREDG
ncbi:hypothetical protein IWX49DRAFT_634162 [Phyllosticta citricarpa]